MIPVKGSCPISASSGNLLKHENKQKESLVFWIILCLVYIFMWQDLACVEGSLKFSSKVGWPREPIRQCLRLISAFFYPFVAIDHFYAPLPISISYKMFFSCVINFFCLIFGVRNGIIFHQIALSQLFYSLNTNFQTRYPLMICLNSSHYN